MNKKMLSYTFKLIIGTFEKKFKKQRHGLLEIPFQKLKACNPCKE